MRGMLVERHLMIEEELSGQIWHRRICYVCRGGRGERLEEPQVLRPRTNRAGAANLGRYILMESYKV